jgi:predicted Zn-dependent protease
VRLKPGNKTTWVALIKGLYIAGYFEEAITQLTIARDHCGDKPDFYYYGAAILIEMGKTKEGLQQLEQGLREAPTRVKIFTGLNPEHLRRAAVVDLIGKYKKK